MKAIQVNGGGLELIRLAIDAGKRCNIPVGLVLAFCSVESNWNQWAWRPEARYRFLWNCATDTPFRRLTITENNAEAPPADFPAYPGAASAGAEWTGQQASWGLMQVMGAVAREMGFHGPYLPQLCDPATGLDIGTKFFLVLMARHGKALDAIAAYNAGSPQRNPDGTYINQQYVDKVTAKWHEWDAWLVDNPKAVV